MLFVLGIDIGSASSKGIALGDQGPLGFFECPSGGDFKLTADRIKQELLFQVGIPADNISRIVATGYGSKLVAYANEVKPDIVCHGKGVFSLLPSVRTIIDVGDLYTKVLRIDAQGSVHKFLLSGKCAGGSGRILQVIAKVLQVKVEEIGELSLASRKRVDFNTGCAVFAESEAISRISEEVKKEDLLAGIHRALAAQINSLAERIGVEQDVAMVGGGARDVGLVHALKETMGHDILAPPRPQLTAALGAAIIALESVKQSSGSHQSKERAI
ncbi:MAG TPA: acyl-CoA dehydratase activase [Thermodesulfobacteriota bacterium]|nr:acyl-CoA dehydratase activase [Thermodesulfobacteriota bacterium]